MMIKVFEKSIQRGHKWVSYYHVKVQIPVLLPWYDCVARPLANKIAAFIESCAAIGWKYCKSIRLL